MIVDTEVKIVALPLDFCTWHLSAELPFAKIEFVAYDHKR
jgi:hypothetical protein